MLFRSAHGGLENLKLQDWPEPKAGPGQALVQVKACGLNYLDIFVRRGMPGLPVELPRIPGGDISGIVEAVGSGVDRSWIGKRVLVDPHLKKGGALGEHANGGLCEKIAVDGDSLIHMPDNVSFEQAAAIPIAFGTARRMMMTRGQVKKGELVLVLGASGGVGVGCVQIARDLGATVIACASSADKLERLKKLESSGLTALPPPPVATPATRPQFGPDRPGAEPAESAPLRLPPPPPPSGIRTGAVFRRVRRDNTVETAKVIAVETREELVASSQALAKRLGFPGMSFLNLSVADSITSPALPETIDVVTALHACNTATDDAIRFALAKRAQHIVLVPCCQAEVATVLRKHKGRLLAGNPMTEIWRHPLHTREFGSQLTNVLRCLQLEAHGYQVSVTELVGWEHSMKNELIIAQYKDLPRRRPAERLQQVLESVGLEELGERFFTSDTPA